jgi:hypothetical protein
VPRTRMNRRTFAQFGVGALGATRLLRAPLSAGATSLVWQEIATTGDRPAPRWDHTLAADDQGKHLVTFGGRDGDGLALGDMWAFDRRSLTWSAVNGAGPAARFGHAVATSQRTRTMYLFGGQSADQFFNDLWGLDFATMSWQLIDEGTGTAPTARYGTSLVETGDDVLIVSHGFTFEGRFDDTWRFDFADNAWTDVTPTNESDRPLKRCLHEAVWSTANERMLLFGGCSSGFGPCPQGDFWAFDPRRATWS